MFKCIICGKEFIIDKEYLRQFSGSMARKQICSRECYRFAVKNKVDLNKQYEDMKRGRFKPVKT